MVDREHEPHYRAVVRELTEGSVIPLLGAGVNLCDRPAEFKWERGSEHLPSGAELARHLAGVFYYPENGELPQAVEQPQDVDEPRVADVRLDVADLQAEHLGRDDRQHRPGPGTEVLGGRADLDRASVGADDLLDDEEAQAQALGALPGVRPPREGLEDGGQIVSGDGRSSVAHAQDDLARHKRRNNDHDLKRDRPYKGMPGGHFLWRIVRFLRTG